MKFWQKLSPNYLPPNANQGSGLQIHREKIIQVLLIIFGVTGLPSIILASIGAVADGKPALVFLYTGIYLLLVAMLVNRSWPYRLRGSVLVSFAYLLALAELFESGQLGEVRMFLLAFVAVTAVLFNYRAVIGSILLGTLTVVAAGLLSTLAPVPLLPSLAHLSEGTDWVTSTVVFVMLALMVAGSVTMIISGLEANLKEQAALAHKLETERNMLDLHIQERTAALERGLVQLRTAAEVSRAISALEDQQALLQQVTETLKERFSLYYVGVFLVDEERQYAVLKAGTGEAGQQMIANGHRLAIGGSSMIGWCIANHQARIALDVGAEAVRFNNPLLPLTRSEMALPIVAHDEIFGALTIQSEKPGAFDDGDLISMVGLAGSLAIALENARLFQETRQNLEEIRTLNRDYLQHAWSEAMQTYGDLSYEFHNQPGASQDLRTVRIPLILRGEAIGEMELELDREEFSEEEGSYLENITTQTAIALENARLLQQTERKAVQEQRLNEIASRFSRASSIDEILRAAAQELGQLPAVSEVSVRLTPMGVQQPHTGPQNGNGSQPGLERDA